MCRYLNKAGVASVFVGPGSLSRCSSSPLVAVRSRHRLFLTRRGMCFALLSSGLMLPSERRLNTHTNLNTHTSFSQRERQRLEGFGCRERAPVCVSPALLSALPPYQDPSSRHTRLARVIALVLCVCIKTAFIKSQKTRVTIPVFYSSQIGRAHV